MPEGRSDGPKCPSESEVAIIYYRIYYGLCILGLRVCSDKHTSHDRKESDEPAQHRDATHAA